MGWHYQAKEFTDDFGETYIGIVESYPDLGKGCYTAGEVTIAGRDLEDLKKWLRVALEDIEKYPIIEYSSEE